MKSDILHSGKYFQFERHHSYQCHLDRVHKITRQRNHSTIMPGVDLAKQHQNNQRGYKKQKQYKLQMQNDRLVKKLSQISQRKSREVFEPQSQKSQQLYTINMRSRNYERVHRQRLIQVENEKFVQRILEQFKRHKSISDLDPSVQSVLNRSRSKNARQTRNKTQPKRNYSSFLPAISPESKDSIGTQQLPKVRVKQNPLSHELVLLKGKAQ